MSELTERTLRKLASRAPLAVDPRSSVAHKRNVHEFIIDAPAKRFAEAFHAAMTEPDARFGKIDVRRDPALRGRPFIVGERFHGCVSVAASYPRLAIALERLGLRGIATFVEDAALSDYSEITEIEEEGSALVAAYRYLEGSPIAGESRFEITAIGEGRCRLRATFAYQEIGALAVLVLHLFAAKLHDDVVVQQVRRAAERAGASIVWSTMAA
jgi:hypothetical protein